jgi:hypothetical protein
LLFHGPEARHACCGFFAGADDFAQTASAFQMCENRKFATIVYQNVWL